MTLVILKALNPHLVNIKTLSVMIMTLALMTHAVLYKDVFTLIILTNVFPQINVMMLNATKNKDVLSLIPLTAARILTNVMNLLVTKK